MRIKYYIKLYDNRTKTIFATMEKTPQHKIIILLIINRKGNIRNFQDYSKR